MGCSSAPKTNEESKISAAQENLLGREALPQIRRDYPALQNAEKQKYVKAVGAKLVKANKLDNGPIEYSFTVVDVPMANAFSLPGGYVFITLPLLTSVQSEAELAGILGHEIGHIEAHHAALRMAAEKRASSQSWLYTTGGVAAGVAGASLLCKGSSSCAGPFIVTSAVVGMKTALLIQKHKFFANRQDDELEADRLGFEIARKSGYSVDHIGDFYSRLQKQDADAKFADTVTTHPPSLVRVQQLEKLVANSRLLHSN